MRKTKLVDCNPRWGRYYHGQEIEDCVTFDCPEGHEHCLISVQVSPARDGSPQPVRQRNGAQWQRTGDTFETMSLTPSIRSEGPVCFFHGFVTNGEITFCGDSR